MKKAIVLIMVIVMMTGVVVCAETSLEFINCSILQKAMKSSFGEESIMLKTMDINGLETVYNCADKITINGKKYRNGQDIFDAIEEDSFAMMAVEDGVITVLNFDASSEKYENIEYEEKKRCFNTLSSKESNLPIYYRYGRGFAPSHTDGNHYYDIEVYDYAICITAMKSKEEKAVIDYIEIDSAIGRNFQKSIEIYCEYEGMDTYILKGELYDKNNTLITENEGQYGELSFGNLENESEIYTIKLWLSDEEGNEISNKYVKEYKMKKAEVTDAVILKKATDSSISGDFVMLKTVDAKGNENVYTLAEKVRINGNMYRDIDEIENAIEENSFARMAVSDGFISVLNFAKNTAEYENAEYNSEENSFTADDMIIENLPVYYKYGDDFVPAYIDENHYYDIEVCEYGVCINGIKSKTDKAVIEYIEAGSAIGRNFKQSVNIYCEYDGMDTYILNGEIYDKNNTLLMTNEGSYGEISFGELENKDEIYTVKIWLSDEDGNEISSKYVKEYKMKETEVTDAVILRKATDSSISGDFVILKTVDAKGNENVYTLAEKVRINGNMYRDIDEIENAIEENSFARMAVSDGFVTVLNFAENTTKYENAEYNSETKAFTADGTHIGNLPVYYKYGGDFVSVYIDENHYYDIDVCDYGICIKGVKSKTGAEVINYIDVSSKTGANFNQVVTVYCEADENKQFILKGKIYDEKINLVASAQSECNGFGELVFNDINNKSENCTVEIWLEDESNNKVSESYLVNQKLRQGKIKYGNVKVKYSDEEEGKVILSIRDIDGNDNVYICDSNTNIITSPEVFSLKGQTPDIPENAFIKMEVDNSVITAVEIEPNKLEMFTQDIEYDDYLEGDMYVINNTEDSYQVTCYVAVYSASDELKHCETVMAELNSGDHISVLPKLSEYEYSDGDYLRVFVWEKGNLKSIIKCAPEDIVCK